DLSLGGRMDCVHEVVEGETLEYDGPRTRPYGVYRVIDALGRGDDDYGYFPRGGLDIDECVTVHLKIQEKHGACDRLENREHVVGTLELGDNVDLGLKSEHELQPLTKESVVVGDEHSNARIHLIGNSIRR